MCVLWMHFICSFWSRSNLVSLSFPLRIKRQKDSVLHSVPGSFPSPVLGIIFRCFSPVGSWSPLVCISASKLLCWENLPHELLGERHKCGEKTAGCLLWHLESLLVPKEVCCTVSCYLDRQERSETWKDYITFCKHALWDTTDGEKCH